MKNLLVIFWILLVSFSASAQDFIYNVGVNGINTNAVAVNSNATVNRNPIQLENSTKIIPVSQVSIYPGNVESVLYSEQKDYRSNYYTLLTHQRTSNDGPIYNRKGKNLLYNGNILPIKKGVKKTKYLSDRIYSNTVNNSTSKDATSTKLFDTSGKFLIGVSFEGGSGYKEFKLAKTTEGETVTISPGGGGGGIVSLGYCVSPKFNVNVGVGAQTSSLSTDVSNATGSFSRTVFLGSLRYKIPVSSNSVINLGGGAGYYMGGKLDLDFSEVSGGEHDIYDFDNVAGTHVLFEFEKFISKWSRFNARWAWSIGLKYYNVMYKVNSVTADGYSIPVSYLPDDVKKMDGSGIDVVFSLITHL